MRIAITRFPYESQLGGEELHTLSVAKHWRDQGHEIELFSSCPVLIKLFSEAGLKVHEFNLTKPPVTHWQLLKFTFFYPFYLLRAWRLARLLSSRQIEFVYCLSFTEKLLLPWFLPNKVRFVFLEHARIGRWFTKNPWRALYNYFAQKGRVVTVSKQMQTAISAPNVQVIPNGIDYKFFANRQRSDWQAQPGQKVLTTIGRLTEDKGIRDFVSLLELLKDEDDWQAVIVGSGPLKAELTQQLVVTNLADRVQLIENLERQEIAGLLQQTDCFFLASTQADPFGLVVAEAMAAGAQAVVTSVCGIVDYAPELAVVEPGQPQELLKAYREISKAGTNRADISKAAQRFDQKVMLSKYDELLG